MQLNAAVRPEAKEAQCHKGDEMDAHVNHTTDQEPGSPGHLRRAGAMAVVLMAVSLLVAACSLPWQAQANSPNGSSTPNASGALAMSRCMRSHGVPNFPDPKSDGGVSIDQASGIDPQSPQFQEAEKACRALAPQGRGGPTQQDRAKILKYAQCMRAHGISDFPDPKPDGGIQIEGKPGSNLTPDNPEFQAADKACKQYMPAGPGGTTHVNQG